MKREWKIGDHFCLIGSLVIFRIFKFSYYTVPLDKDDMIITHVGNGIHYSYRRSLLEQNAIYVSPEEVTRIILES